MQSDIVSPLAPDPDVAFMRLALEEALRAKAEGNSAVGCLIVRDGHIVMRGRNLVYTTSDPTAHAETVAIRDLAQATRQLEFPGHTLYTTFEPCPMCAGAIAWTGLSRLVMGSRFATFNLRGSYHIEAVMQLVGNPLEIVTGVLEAECDALMRP